MSFYENHICGNPECPRDHCRRMPYIKAYIYASQTPDLPLMWHFRTNSIQHLPSYIQDSHICHMTRVPEMELLRAIRVSEDEHRWIYFDPSIPFTHHDLQDELIILKCVDIEDTKCFGLAQFVSKLDIML
uniref:Uncharacterized protein n=1 Tax=Psilocybe cubensis TaxID=181762 RepID=A0A8H7XPL7_PSICU